MQAIEHLRNFYRRIMGFILPPNCLGCAALLPHTEDIGFCPKCWKNLPHWDTSKVNPPILPRAADSFNAPFLYFDAIKELIPRMKYADQQEIARALVPFLTSVWPSTVAKPLVVPLPLHPRKLRLRLFNQAHILAKRCAAYKQIEYAPLALHKTKHTAPQASKSADNRRKLNKQAFKADAVAVEGRHVILIDDIWTTGSTCGSAAWALKVAGAESVHVLTLAYVPPEGTDKYITPLQESKNSATTIPF